MTQHLCFFRKPPEQTRKIIFIPAMKIIISWLCYLIHVKETLLRKLLSSPHCRNSRSPSEPMLGFRKIQKHQRIILTMGATMNPKTIQELTLPKEIITTAQAWAPWQVVLWRITKIPSKTLITLTQTEKVLLLIYPRKLTISMIKHQQPRTLAAIITLKPQILPRPP